MSNDNEFIMDPKKGKAVDGFIPNVEETVGYGTLTAIDPATGKRGVVPIPTQVERGADGQERLVDNPDCYAKVIKFEGDTNYTYYIRMSTRGDVSDPWGLYADAAQNSRQASHRGTHAWEFRRVDERAFMTYLRYLVTRNGALLRICERDIKDA
jgi:hypothetical protein